MRRPPPLPQGWVVPGRMRRRTLVITGALAAALFLVEGFLDVKLQDSGDGILSFEVAGTSDRAQEIVAGWGDDRSTAEIQLWLDFPFLVSVAVFMAVAVLAVGERLAARPRLMAAAGAVAWLPLLAGAADIFENAALLIILGGETAEPLPALALTAALAKYLFGLTAAGYVLAGLVVGRSTRARPTVSLREIEDGLWVHEAPLRFTGVEVGRIMNVVQLGDGGLFVHSPAPLDDALRAAVEALGEVRFVVAPSRLHGYLSMPEWRAAYPRAELLGGPGLAQRRRKLHLDAELGEGPDPRWAEVLDQAPFRGNRLLPEIEFLHRPSRTLILADLAMNLGEHPARMTRALARLGGMRGRLQATPAFRLTTRDRDTAKRDIERILDWDFDRVIPGHGAIWESGGKEALRRAWLG